jgi:hypothetical protein
MYYNRITIINTAVVMKKSELISLRLKSEDLLFLNELGKEYGKTTSEKIRTLIDQAKEKKLKSEHFVSALDFSTHLYAQSRTKLVRSMSDFKMKSEVLDLFHEWLINASALYQTLEKEKSLKSKENLKQFEEEILDEIVFLLDKFMRLGLSETSRVINAELFRTKLKSLMFLANTVEKTLEQKG